MTSPPAPEKCLPDVFGVTWTPARGGEGRESPGLPHGSARVVGVLVDPLCVHGQWRPVRQTERHAMPHVHEGDAHDRQAGARAPLWGEHGEPRAARAATAERGQMVRQNLHDVVSAKHLEHQHPQHVFPCQGGTRTEGAAR